MCLQCQVPWKEDKCKCVENDKWNVRNELWTSRIWEKKWSQEKLIDYKNTPEEIYETLLRMFQYE